MKLKARVKSLQEKLDEEVTRRVSIEGSLENCQAALRFLKGALMKRGDQLIIDALLP